MMRCVAGGEDVLAKQKQGQEAKLGNPGGWCAAAIRIDFDQGCALLLTACPTRACAVFRETGQEPR